MKTICLALNKFSTPKNVHPYLKEKLAFPSYFGNNLDALYDVLSTYHEPLTICIHCGHTAVAQNPQWQSFLHLLHDVSKENPRIQIID
jgi:ribonuclease inhibitor